MRILADLPRRNAIRMAGLGRAIDARAIRSAIGFDEGCRQGRSSKPGVPDTRRSTPGGER